MARVSKLVAKGRWAYRSLWAHRRDFGQMSFWIKSGRIAARLAQAALWPDLAFKRTLQVFEQRPWNLHIETTNACNADCVFCAYQYMERRKKVMPLSIYTKALDDYVALGGGSLHLEVVVGDPILDPTFLEKVRLARARPEITDIETITNALGVDRLGAEKFIESGISSVFISTAGFNRENYIQLYRTKHYEKMRGNVLALLKANERAGRPVEITIGFRTNRSLEEVFADPDFQEIRRYEPRIDFTYAFDDWGGRINLDELPSGFVRRERPVQTESCVWLYDGPIIFLNGDVGLCGCQDVEAKSDLIVGNIRERSLYEIWNSERVQRLRQGFMDPAKKPDICQRCTSYRNMDALRSVEGVRRALLTRRRLRVSACQAAAAAGPRHLPVIT